MKISLGYTLIELVVVAAIIGVIGVVSVSLFLTSLSGGGKSSGTNELRANGDYAITQMERMIRNALRVEGTCESNMQSITILNRDGATTTFSVVGGKIASNSGNLVSENMDLVAIDVGGGQMQEIDIDCLSQSNSVPSTVNITFRLGKKNLLTNKFEEVEAEFATSVQLRTY